MIKARHVAGVEAAGGLAQVLFHRRGAPLRHLTGQSQFMIAKKPTEPFMIDRLAGALFQLRKDPAIAVTGVPSADAPE